MAQKPIKIKLTKESVEAIQAPASGELVVWDEDLTGFGVRVSVKGRRTYFIYGRTVAGKQIKMKVGVHGAIAADQARKIAKAKLGEIAGGGDPAAERSAARKGEADRLKAPTVRELGEEYLSAHAALHKRESSAAADKATLKTIIYPRLGSRKVADITYTEIAALHRAMHATPYRANRVVALLSKMFSLSIRWGMRNDNPARGVERYQEIKRQRYLRPDELGRLARVLAEHPNRTSADAVRLLLLTGARRNEVLSATWDQIDFDAGVWTKPGAKTKQKTEHRVPLSPAALELLTEIKTGVDKKIDAARQKGRIVPRPPFIFPGRGDGVGHLTDIKHFWSSVCEEAEIEGARLHDLRHTYASLLVSAGLSLPIIGQLLGHTQPSTTARYAHVDFDPMRLATGLVADRLAEIGQAPRKKEALPVGGRGR